MPRRKLYYGYIRNANARKLSLKKRRQHILKKVQELTILCGIEGCAIVFSPDEPEPTFWPSYPQVRNMLLRYESIPDIEKCSKKINQEGYIKDSIKKMEKNIKAIESKNRELENDQFLHQIFRAGKKYEEFTREELTGLKAYVEERKKVLLKRMHLHQGSISEGNELILPDEELEIRIEDEDPLFQQWFFDMLTDETQYDVSSSSNSNSVAAEKQMTVDDVIDHTADMSPMFEISLGENGEIVARSYTMEICNGNSEGINNLVVHEGGDGSNALMVEQGINNGNLEGIINQVVEGAANNINAAMFPHGNNQISVGQEIIPGASSYNAMEIYNGNPNEGINNGNEEAEMDELEVFLRGNNQGSETVNGWSPPGFGEFNVGQGFHHDILDFPDNTNMFGATLLSNNSMDVDQPNYVSNALDYDIFGGNGGEDMAQQPGNHNNYIN